MQETGYFAHGTAVIDPGVLLKRHKNMALHTHNERVCNRRGCNIGQNVVVSPEVVLGNNVKVQTNVSIYTGVICRMMFFLAPHVSSQCG